MIIKTLAVALAFALVPMYMGASTINALGEDSCLVPVYNTTFAFPAEGGEIVRIGNQMYFVKNYLPECAGAASGGQVIRSSSSGAVAGNQSPGSGLPNGILEENCLVPVYNTTFAFPAEGGEIVRIGSQMFFVKNYLSECANAGNGGQVIRAGTNSQPDTSCIRPS